MDRHEAAMLDRHITGNYGEDQIREGDEDEIPGTCLVRDCGRTSVEYLCAVHEAEAEAERAAEAAAELAVCPDCEEHHLRADMTSCESCERLVCATCLNECCGGPFRGCRACHRRVCRTPDCWDD